MSVFKNFGKVLSQATLNSASKTYILNLKNSVQNPALFYLNQAQPPKDIFQLSLVTYHLVRKTESGRNLLQQVETETGKGGSHLADVSERLAKEYNQSNRLASEYVDELARLLRLNAGNLPIHNAVQSLYAFEATKRADRELYDRFLFPVIKEKLQYASLNNLIELTSLLAEAQYFQDKELWNKLIEQLNVKLERPGPKYVKYSGWTLDSYELDESANADRYNTESERYWADRKKGGSKFMLNLRYDIRNVVDRVRNVFINRFVFGEARVTQGLDNFQERLDRDRLRKSLETARSAGFSVDGLLGRLRP